MVQWTQEQWAEKLDNDCGLTFILQAVAETALLLSSCNQFWQEPMRTKSCILNIRFSLYPATTARQISFKICHIDFIIDITIIIMNATRLMIAFPAARVECVEASSTHVPNISDIIIR